MKTHLIIFLTAFFVAIPVFGQQKNLTLHFKDVTIKKVLDEIKKQEKPYREMQIFQVQSLL